MKELIKFSIEHNLRPFKIMLKNGSQIYLVTGRNILIQLYRHLGLIVISFILILVLSYMGTVLFFVVNSSWGIPMILSPYSEKVLNSRSMLISTKNKNFELKLKNHELKNKIQIIAKELNYNNEYLNSLKESLLLEKKSKETLLQQLQLISINSSTRKAKSKKSKSFSIKDQFKLLAQDFDSGLLDKNSYYQTQQTLSSQLIGQADLSNKIDLLKREVETLDYFQKNLDLPERYIVTAPTMLYWIKEYYKFKNLNANLIKESEILQNQINVLNKSIHEYDQIIKTIKQSPYYKAINQDITIAFVPYTNIQNTSVNTSIYSCALGIFWCEKIGVVKKILDGEIQLPHPFFSKKSRGLMVYMELSKKGAKDDLLHFGSKPWSLI